jgi:predicted HicB family RNase H-like nuclease
MATPRGCSRSARGTCVGLRRYSTVNSASTVFTVRYSLAVCALDRPRRMGHVAYKIDDDLHARAKALAAYKGQTFKAWLERAILAAVETQEDERRDDQRRRRRR